MVFCGHNRTGVPAVVGTTGPNHQNACRRQTISTEKLRETEQTLALGVVVCAFCGCHMCVRGVDSQTNKISVEVIIHACHIHHGA